MIIGFGMAGMNKGHLVDMFSQVRKDLRNRFSTLPARSKLERALHQATHCVGEETRKSIKSFHGLTIHFLKSRLIIPGIDLTGSAVDEYPDNRLSFASEMRHFRTQWIRCSEESLIRKETG